MREGRGAGPTHKTEGAAAGRRNDCLRAAEGEELFNGTGRAGRVPKGFGMSLASQHSAGTYIVHTYATGDGGRPPSLPYRQINTGIGQASSLHLGEIRLPRRRPGLDGLQKPV